MRTVSVSDELGRTLYHEHGDTVLSATLATLRRLSAANENIKQLRTLLCDG